MTSLLRGALRGAGAGAAGKAALDLVTHAGLVAASRADERRDARGAGPEPTLRAPSLPDLVRAASLGAATGCRSTAGPTAVALRSTPRDRGTAGRLARRSSRAPAVLAALGEIGADKHPAIPPRTGAPGLAPRVVLGATACSAVARRDGVEGGVPALVGAAAAVGAAVAGQRARAAARRRLGTDLPGALTEDALAAVLAAFGARRPARADRATGRHERARS